MPKPQIFVHRPHDFNIMNQSVTNRSSHLANGPSPDHWELDLDSFVLPDSDRIRWG